ncbi:MAG: translation initiation factor IF-2 [Candidatus Doudnabacteria bacterium]|nr:translation initiation factor IF-2 [Candidatus Doudnabacteria bacterium]
MDLSTLSRQLNMSIHELRDQMKQAGFRLSPRARKVDNNLARKIIASLSGKPKVEVVKYTGPAKIQIPPFIPVKDFAQKLQQPVTEVIKKLLQNGVMATINEEIDAETATIIASEFGVEVGVEHSQEDVRLGLGYIQEILAKEDAAKLLVRPPIVAVMGHVDHGKTTLLDTIRKTNVAALEAGAITQKIGAYQVSHQGKLITFLDTPGHEAFVAMRARGANVTDIIVLVIAADDSAKPQTVEVINRAKLIKIPLIVALNKIDKPEANPDKVKADLASLGITIEEWGGKVPVVPISAKMGQGIDKLLEIILLMAEVESFRANPEGRILGAVIDSHLSRGQGAVATVLVQNGTLRVGDPVVVGSTYGKIRTMEDAGGKKLRLASPATPVQISGLSGVPEVGDILRVVPSLEEAKMQATSLLKQERAKKLLAKPIIKADPNKKELKIILRAGIQGSLEALQDVLSKLSSEDVKLTIVDQGVGDITESDISLAENTQSTIVGFHTRMLPTAVKLARQKNVVVDLYEVIYELVEDITQALLSMMPIEVVETKLGRAKIKAIFRTEKTTMIVGGEMIEGKIVDKKRFRILRDKQQIGEGKIEELQQNRMEVSEVADGREFGVKAQVNAPIKAGDILEIFDEAVKKKELK